MNALLDRDASEISDGVAVPPLWHWLYFLPHARQSELAADGHPRRGGFLPPVPLPRRMWAGGRLEFHHPLRAGDAITRRSVIKQVETKEGRSGQLAFVCVAHEISNSAGLAIYEEHDIVYRENPAASVSQSTPKAAKSAPATSDYSRHHLADPVTLFRYSALTFNGHRIHYDRDYVTGEEGYPGLIVHGPLLATLLVELCRENQPDARLRKFEFRALSPVFDGKPFTACGKQVDSNNTELWIADSDNNLCMQATAVFQ
ncbi:MAG: MaoC family dehydratase N-terminal domain-containing protein [Gammaproteobacteria bacterium]|nr:MaoC family dehydratase N-terminal domain-containing protein [Gammaproteobacteria bacterium]